MKKILVLCVLLSGCLHASKETPLPIPELDEPAHSTEAESLVEPVSTKSKLVVPFGSCEAPSLALQPLPGASPTKKPALIENFQSGCPTELWTHSVSNEETVDAYIPWVHLPVYYVPRPVITSVKIQGLVETKEVRSFYDGEPTRRVVTTRDNTGVVLSTDVFNLVADKDTGISGSHTRTEFTSSGDKRLIRSTWPDEVSEAWTEYDAAGRPLKRMKKSGKHPAKIVEDWKYADGRVVQHREYSETPFITHSYAWEANGFHTKTSRRPLLGWIDVREFDSNGRLLSHTQDTDSDGVIDYLEAKTYDASGNLLTDNVEYDFVNGKAGSGRSISLTYEGERLISSVETTHGAIAATLRSDITYEYSENSRKVMTLTEHKGKISRHVLITDASGREVFESHGAQGEEPEWSVERTFRGDLQLSETRTSSGTQRVTEWVYDDQDRLLLRAVDSDGDGIADTGTRYRYDVDALEAYKALNPPVF